VQSPGRTEGATAYLDADLRDPQKTLDGAASPVALWAGVARKP
jgi:hypothetical protein